MMRDIYSMSRGKCLYPLQAKLSTAQLGFPDKSCAIK